MNTVDTAQIQIHASTATGNKSANNSRKRPRRLSNHPIAFNDVSQFFNKNLVKLLIVRLRFDDIFSVQSKPDILTQKGLFSSQNKRCVLPILTGCVCIM